MTYETAETIITLPNDPGVSINCTKENKKAPVATSISKKASHL